MYIYFKKKLEYYKGILIKADYSLHKQVSNIINALNKKGNNLLDFGAGEGAFSQRMLDYGYNVISVDIDDKNFKAMSDFYKIDINRLNLNDEFIRKYNNFFDIVVSLEVIEHIENQFQFIKILKTLCCKDGYIIVTTPNIHSWYSRITFLFNGKFAQFEENDLTYGHINPLYIQKMLSILKKENLTLVEILPGGTLPRFILNLKPKSIMKNILGFTFSFFMKGFFKGWCLIFLIKK